MASLIPLSEIPTLTLLYKLNHLAPPSPTVSTPPPSKAYNDKIALIRHDITKLKLDSIVNAANESLLGGGGVDGAIHRGAGPNLLRECEGLNGCETGSAKITGAYELPCKKVIHAVGPIYIITKRVGRHTSLLQSCYRTSLQLAVDNGMKSIAFSALSTGVYGYPSDEAAAAAIGAVRRFLDEGKGDTLDKIVFCNFMEKDEDAYLETLPRFFPPVEEAPEPEPTTDTNTEELSEKLPDPPTTDPKDAEEPETKRVKTEYEGEGDEDWEKVEKPGDIGEQDGGTIPRGPVSYEYNYTGRFINMSAKIVFDG
ncbi:A1pp-domain-containing protein [Patellaria atrata CBS 101060]|uniref:A1pp-domain-containing protein n=1 Tax=Patellaria atrata CBS 101060 TaxID=1346257 RepID=A0A9P4VPZ7_9PEZI|nr:A1pp-domain-containing protein [Patellaria atrata CBS 101060]